MSKFTKVGLMRKNKDSLLVLAGNIDFVDEKMTKSEIADAILIMGVGEAPVVPADSETVVEPSIDDPDYPKSVRVRRILASQ